MRIPNLLINCSIIFLLVALLALPNYAQDADEAGGVKNSPRFATVINSGSTNADGYRLVIQPNGRASFVITSRAQNDARPQVHQAKMPAAMANQFFQDLNAAMPLSQYQAVTCVKSASFGETIYLEYRNQRSPDLACPQDDERLQRLADDLKQMTSFLQIDKFRLHTIN